MEVDYVVCSHISLIFLREQVIQFIKEGYTPVGGIAVEPSEHHPTKYYQAMHKLAQDFREI